jgi:YedE family putative selenium metabolism protein
MIKPTKRDNPRAACIEPGPCVLEKINLGFPIAKSKSPNIIKGINQPTAFLLDVAHTMHLWNFLGMFLAGLTATLLGGCPLRQTILASEGDTDAGITILGLIAGAAVSHNFLLASSAKGVGVFSVTAVIIGIIFTCSIGFVMSEEA